jgi:hypothetical protein
LLEESDSGSGSSDGEDGFDFAPVRRDKNQSIMSNANFMKDAAKEAQMQKEDEAVKPDDDTPSDFFS